MGNLTAFGQVVEKQVVDSDRYVDNWLLDIDSLSSKFLNFMLRSFGFTAIENFNIDGSVIFAALNKTTTFEGFSSILKAIFLTNEFTLEHVAGAKLNIHIHNENAEMMHEYVDSNNDYYVDSTKKYVGFGAADISSFESFFTIFLTRFLIAGLTINKLSLENKEQL